MPREHRAERPRSTVKIEEPVNTRKTTMHILLSTVTTIPSTVKERSARRRARTQLERELASYASPSDRRELDAILARHTADETALIEEILNRQALTGKRAS